MYNPLCMGWIGRDACVGRVLVGRVESMESASAGSPEGAVRRDLRGSSLLPPKEHRLLPGLRQRTPGIFSLVT